MNRSSSVARLFTLGCGVAFVVACADLDGPADEHVDQSESGIIGGTPDFEHDAVVAIFGPVIAGKVSSCTGTIIHHEPPSAYILTAAHCFGSGPIQVSLIGDDYNNPTKVMSVVDYVLHPQYNGNSGDYEYDFAMIQVTGATGTVPVIPPMSPAEDVLNVGSQVDHVGYGLLSYPNGQTSVRHHVLGALDQVGSIQILYQQPSSGPCSGDSGGPNLAASNAGEERVAGVISYGDETCASFGVSGRVSFVYDSFIVPFVGTTPSGSSSTATTTTGVGGGDPTTTGVGGAGPSSGAGANSNWTAPGVEEEDYGDGTLLTSGSCSVDADGPDADGSSGRQDSWAWLIAALGLIALRRRG
jgi:MYXO-CTERM domain-containing protein